MNEHPGLRRRSGAFDRKPHGSNLSSVLRELLQYPPQPLTGKRRNAHESGLKWRTSNWTARTSYRSSSLRSRTEYLFGGTEGTLQVIEMTLLLAKTCILVLVARRSFWCKCALVFLSLILVCHQCQIPTFQVRRQSVTASTFCSRYEKDVHVAVGSPCHVTWLEEFASSSPKNVPSEPGPFGHSNTHPSEPSEPGPFRLCTRHPGVCGNTRRSVSRTSHSTVLPSGRVVRRAASRVCQGCGASAEGECLPTRPLKISHPASPKERKTSLGKPRVCCY